MKVLVLRKKIIINASLALILLTINLVVFFFYSKIEENAHNEITEIENQSNAIRAKIEQIKNKEEEIKKYKALWLKIDEKHKYAQGIKAADFNSKLESLAKKHLIKIENIKIDLPQELKQGAFLRDSFEISYSFVSLNYSAFNDIMAVSFVEEFLSSLYGYPIVTYFEMIKSNSYSAQDLENLSYGKLKGLVNGRLEFFWYVPKSLHK